MRLNPIRRGFMLGRNSGLNAASVNRMTSPPMVRTVSTSKMESAPASPRIDSASVENDRSTPVIHRTTRRMREGEVTLRSGSRIQSARRAFGAGASFRIRLVFRPRFVEGGQLVARRLDAEDFREFLERHFEPARIVDLRDQANIGDRDMRAERVRRRA